MVVPSFLLLVLLAPPDRHAPDPAVLVARAQLFLELREFDRAVETLGPVVEREPDDLDTRFLLGLAQYGAGRSAAAARTFRHLTSRRPDDALAWEFLGRTEFERERFQSAIDAFTRAVELEPNRSRPRNHLGAAWLRLGDTDRARRAFGRAVELDGEFAIARYNLGVLCALEGDVAEATLHLRRAVELDPEDGDSPEALGDLYREGNDLAAARRWYRIATERSPGRSRPWLHLARLHEREEERFLAEECYRNAVSADDSGEESRVGLARLLARGLDLDEALRWYREALRFAPESAELHREAADVAQDLGRAAAARSLLVRAHDLGHRDPDLLRRICLLDERLGEAERARSTFRLLVLVNDGRRDGVLAVADRMAASSLDGIRDVETGRSLARSLVARSRGRDLAALLVLIRAESAAGEDRQAAEIAARAGDLAGVEEGSALAGVLRRAASRR